MPSPLGEGQTVPPKNRHHRGEVPCGRFAGRTIALAHYPDVTPLFYSELVALYLFLAFNSMQQIDHSLIIVGTGKLYCIPIMQRTMTS